MLAQNLLLLAMLYRFAPPPPVRTTLLWAVYTAVVAAFLSGEPLCC